MKVHVRIYLVQDGFGNIDYATCGESCDTIQIYGMQNSGEEMLYLKIGFLFLAIWFSLVNSIRFFKSNSIPGMNIILQAIGITGFIVIQWLI